MSKGRKVGGGKDQFKWEDVAKDPHRTNYLGNSLFTSQQKTWSNPNPREVDFYLKDGVKKSGGESARDEKAAIKAEEDAMMAKLLGLPPPAPKEPESPPDSPREHRSRDKERRSKSKEHRHKHKHKERRKERSPDYERRGSPDRARPREKSSHRRDDDDYHRYPDSPRRSEDKKRRRTPSPSPERYSDSTKRAKYQED